MSKGILQRMKDFFAKPKYFFFYKDQNMKVVVESCSIGDTEYYYVEHLFEEEKRVTNDGMNFHKETVIHIA